MSTIKELTNRADNLQQTLDTKQREMDEVKEIFDASNEELDALCEQRAEEIHKLKSELSMNSNEITRQENALKERQDDIELLNQRLYEMTRQFDDLVAKHEHCIDYEQRIESLQQELHQVQLVRQEEESNSEILKKAFEEKEKSWEEEKENLTSSSMKIDEMRKTESNLLTELSRVENENKELQDNLEIKSKELAAQQLLCEQKAADFSEIEIKLKAKLETLELRYDDLKYTIKQKEEEMLLLEDKVRETENLEKKVACAEEIELELRHHLGEVTQELQTLKESIANDNLESDDKDSLQQKLSDALTQVSFSSPNSLRHIDNSV